MVTEDYTPHVPVIDTVRVIRVKRHKKEELSLQRLSSSSSDGVYSTATALLF
jgi:hypothetical protein